MKGVVQPVVYWKVNNGIVRYSISWVWEMRTKNTTYFRNQCRVRALTPTDYSFKAKWSKLQLNEMCFRCPNVKSLSSHSLSLSLSACLLESSFPKMRPFPKQKQLCVSGQFFFNAFFPTLKPAKTHPTSILPISTSFHCELFTGSSASTQGTNVTAGPSCWQAESNAMKTWRCGYKPEHMWHLRMSLGKIHEMVEISCWCSISSYLTAQKGQCQCYMFLSNSYPLVEQSKQWISGPLKVDTSKN